MANEYNIMAKHIVSQYVDRISGNDIFESFTSDEAPDRRVMVGMLAENRVSTTFDGGYVENNSTRFESVPSISISFVIEKRDNCVINVIPTGMFFYTIRPVYSACVDYILRKYSEKDRTIYTSISELCALYPTERIPVPMTYKKINLESVMGNGIDIDISKIEKRFHLEHQITEKLSVLSDQIMDEICIINDTYVCFGDLVNEERFKIAVTIKEEKACPRWDIDILCKTFIENNNIRFIMQMVNKTMTTDRKNVGYMPVIFNAGMKVVGNNETKFIDIKMKSFLNNYKEHKPVYAVAENISVDYNSKLNEIKTENVPLYFQKRLKTKDDLTEYVTFDKLIENPISNLSIILSKMEDDYIACQQEYEQSFELSEIARIKFKDSLDDYRREIDRFATGIEQIKYKDLVKRAFSYMNETFRVPLNEQRNIKGWRLFQIVFIVSMICEVIRSEYKDDMTIRKADIEAANLLYFPTGGGKTEAFLGVTVFSMFFDRLRGKTEGVTAVLKYPLRLLAVQQLDRILTITVKANIVLHNSDELKSLKDFETGFYVGSTNTPNKIDVQEHLSDRGSRVKNSGLILDSDTNTLNEYYRFIDTCPVCGEKHVNVKFNTERWMLEHVCDNLKCSMNVLPILIVDSEIYRYLPSIIVCTIDKMAMVGISNEFKMLFGQVKSQCNIHGFSNKSKCMCDKCIGTVKTIPLLKDPIPTLFIQDELHLVKESLGTFDAHYESFIDYYAKKLVPDEQKKQIRFIGATATISQYKEHINHLYHMEARRFPCEYPSSKIGEDFYSYTDETDITRIICGYAPYGRSLTDGMWESIYVMRQVVFSMMHDSDLHYKVLCKIGFTASKEEYENMLFDYWIELVYNNRKQDALELENALQNQGNNKAEAQQIPKFVIEQMTSDVDFQTVRKTLFDIQANRKNVESTNTILATSTISHGVDEDSFNVMYFFGMPNNNAEYIQAYSRTGRKYTGIVIDIIRLMRVRDRSYLKNFVVFHQNKDELVESVPINRWAKNAIYSTLPGILAALIYQYYTLITNEENLYHTINVKKLLLNNKIEVYDATEKIVQAYGCNNHEKMSIAYAEIIYEEVSNILAGIKNGNFMKTDRIADSIAKYSHGRKKPMTSLRDTEEQIEIKI
ncbi:DEAD/DEAH box helicase family protein [Anaerocolumna chitinilytica]|uniref:Helicase C-terminal domain-containing protein n=1 Tax=Anaerocolumna chitinilytica TaxID=1727145 RepID=A0A7I8DKK5_9FIRM|nr:DEAD/DEAH box helicase family protein [Anaerocolumna chitinilytica]BCJ97575.1 hypothetical protein bsdcttw_06160 [Anaerocolumna chitinilytica]